MQEQWRRSDKNPYLEMRNERLAAIGVRSKLLATRMNEHESIKGYQGLWLHKDQTFPTVSYTRTNLSASVPDTFDAPFKPTVVRLEVTDKKDEMLSDSIGFSPVLQIDISGVHSEPATQKQVDKFIHDWQYIAPWNGRYETDPESQLYTQYLIGNEGQIAKVVHLPYEVKDPRSTVTKYSSDVLSDMTAADARTLDASLALLEKKLTRYDEIKDVENTWENRVPVTHYVPQPFDIETVFFDAAVKRGDSITIRKKAEHPESIMLAAVPEEGLLVSATDEKTRFVLMEEAYKAFRTPEAIAINMVSVPNPALLRLLLLDHVKGKYRGVDIQSIRRTFDETTLQKLFITAHELAVQEFDQKKGRKNWYDDFAPENVLHQSMSTLSIPLRDKFQMKMSAYTHGLEEPLYWELKAKHIPGATHEDAVILMLHALNKTV